MTYQYQFETTHDYQIAVIELFDHFRETTQVIDRNDNRLTFTIKADNIIPHCKMDERWYRFNYTSKEV